MVLHVCMPALCCTPSTFNRPKDLQGCSAAPEEFLQPLFLCFRSCFCGSQCVCVRLCVYWNDVWTLTCIFPRQVGTGAGDTTERRLAS